MEPDEVAVSSRRERPRQAAPQASPADANWSAEVPEAANRPRNGREQDEGDGCVFCDWPSVDHLGSVNPNEILTSSRHFIVVPAIGPLVTGHVLAVSKAHHAGLAYASREEMRDLIDLASRFAAVVPDGLLLAEHGGSSGSQAQPCITHTHVHMLPGLPLPPQLLTQNLRRLRHVAGVLDLATLKGSYFFMQAGGDARAYDASESRGQALRRLLAQAVGAEDWDWALYPHPERIRATVAFWRDADV